MREILFRGKSENTRDWVYGSLVYSKVENQYYIAEHDEDELQYPVFAETVGQYTGLTDKNGKQIFEGDIVKDIAGGIYKVVYDTEYMRFAFEQDSIKWGLEGFDSIMDFEVIGNIYDNPELLGGAE